MDSKSISRKGVGVQLPSLAPERARELALVARELAPVLWSSLRQRLRAAREELDDTLRALRRERAGALRDERRLARQEDVRESVHRAGWCLGLLAAAQGVDLLRARREPEGLRWLSAALSEGSGFELAPAAAELPRLAGAALSGLELPLLAAWCAWRAGAASEGLVRWRAARAARTEPDGGGAERAGWQLAFELGPRHEPAELAARCAQLGSADPAAPRLVLEPSRLVLAWL